MIKRQCVVVAAVVVVFVVVALSVIESFVSIPLQSNANRISKIRQVKKTNHTLTHTDQHHHNRIKHTRSHKRPGCIYYIIFVHTLLTIHTVDLLFFFFFSFFFSQSLLYTHISISQHIFLARFLAANVSVKIVVADDVLRFRRPNQKNWKYARYKLYIELISNCCCCSAPYMKTETAAYSECARVCARV